MQRSLSHLIKPVSFVYCLIMLNSLSPYLIIFYQKLSGDSSLSTNEQTRDWNEMQGNGELEDIEILLSFYDNINRVWLCLSLLHKASSILLVFTVCPHRDPVRVHYISNV